jgi:hypothetical protein
MREPAMACLMKPTAVAVYCPYCANMPFKVEGPSKKEDEIFDKQITQGIPNKVECLPLNFGHS